MKEYQFAPYDDIKFSVDDFKPGHHLLGKHRKFIDERHGVISELRLKTGAHYHIHPDMVPEHWGIDGIKTAELSFDVLLNYSQKDYDVNFLNQKSDNVCNIVFFSVRISDKTPIKEIWSETIRQANIVLKRELKNLKTRLQEGDKRAAQLKHIL